MKTIIYCGWEAGILKTNWINLPFSSISDPSTGSQRYDNHHIDTQQMFRVDWSINIGGSLYLGRIKGRPEVCLLDNIQLTFNKPFHLWSLTQCLELSSEDLGQIGGFYSQNSWTWDLVSLFCQSLLVTVR